MKRQPNCSCSCISVVSLLLTLKLPSSALDIKSSSTIAFVPVFHQSNWQKKSHSRPRTSNAHRRSRASPLQLEENSGGGDAISDEYEFQPKFDGQLYYGMAADSEGNIQTTLTEVKSKLKVPSNPIVNEDKAQSTTDATLTSTTPSSSTRERATLHSTPIVSRTITIPSDTDSAVAVTIWEMEKPSTLIEYWMSADTSASDKDKIGDPFGVVMWPGSILASQEIMKRRRTVKNAKVLVLGAGLGVEVQTAARMGAAKVIATDNNPFTLKLLRYGAQRAGLENVIETKLFDICDERVPLPSLEELDMVVVADVLYNERLARHVGKRCWEVLIASRERKREGKKPVALIVTDSQRFHGTDFLKELNVLCGQENLDMLEWNEVMLWNVTGSGILIDEDQTYDVKARMLCVDDR